MPSAEINNLIDAFLAEELDAAGRLRLAALLDSDREAQRAFDDALRLEALLSAAHTDPQAEARAMESLKARLSAEKPSATRSARASTSSSNMQRPALVKRSVRSVTPLRPPGRSPIGAWTALAAAILVLFGLAFYFIYDPAPTGGQSIAKKKDDANAIFTVAAGAVLIDGKDAKSVAENAWVSVPAAGHAELNSKDGTRVKLEGGSRALIRTHGATLQNGAGRFGVKSASDTYELQTPLGKVLATGGEFEAHLANNSTGALELSVTVASGTAQVDAGGKTTVLNKNDVRKFVDNQPRDKKRDGPPLDIALKLKSPEMLSTEAILDHIADLKLTDDQKLKLLALLGKFRATAATLAKDAKIKELFVEQRDAEHDGNDGLARALRQQVKQRSDEVLSGSEILGDPLDILTDDQRIQIEPSIRAYRRDMRGPPGSGGPNHPPPHPSFPPPHPPGGDDRPPPFQ